MSAAMLKKTRLTVLLSLNAAAILIAGILIASALGFNIGEFHVVASRTDEVDTELIADGADLEAASTDKSAIHDSTGSGGIISSDFSISSGTRTWISTDPVNFGELWNENEVTIYRSADIDLCACGGLSGLGAMYWQSSNHSVISNFYSGARTWLGFNNETCRFPIVENVGDTVVTAGTYDGSRRDSITVHVIDIPVEEWKREILTLTNQIRVENGLPTLVWGTTCEKAAQLRAEEIVSVYSHTRPDGSPWSTVCEIPSTGGSSGENLMAGNAAPSPETVVAAWVNSKDHLENILNPDFTHLAVGLVFDPSSKLKIYWSEFFSTY